jgi:hypothetical protein
VIAVDWFRRVVGRRQSPKSNQSAPLERRIDALEAMVEGLQDSVDRQTRRQDDRITELGRRLEPAQLARAISDDARRRGL